MLKALSGDVDDTSEISQSELLIRILKTSILGHAEYVW